MSNVVSIDGGDIVDDREPNEHAVGTLENLLELARSGELVGVAVVCSFFDGTGQIVRSGKCDPVPVVGRLHQLAFDILRATADD